MQDQGKTYMLKLYQLIPCIVIWFTDSVSASYGDRSYIYQKCIHRCMEQNCTHLNEFQEKQPWFESKLFWSCEDECKYECMWTTIDAFEKDQIGVPQFYGKWPFTRFLGMQEPASVIFSILNGLCHLRILQYRQVVPNSTPLYYIWHIVALIALHAWTWSTIYHARDFPLTEMMDYFCAFSLVMANLFSLICRILGTSNHSRLLACALMLLLFYLQHLYYLAFIKFDYGYNMKVNIAVGFVNMMGWVIWCAKNHKNLPYIWKCGVVMMGLNVLLLLEVLDFPPIWWIFDGHSLWHAGTIPLGYLWYSFIIEDGLYLCQEIPKKSV